MEQNVKNNSNNNNELSWFFSQLAAEKKKVVMAICLLTLMIFMWVRVFNDKGPQTADASAGLDEVNTAGANQKSKICFVELPNIMGRNDVLSRDFFTVRDWDEFVAGANGRNMVGIKEINLGLEYDGEEDVKRAAEKLRLEAIGFGRNPQAFINDKLLVVGDVLIVKDGVDTYEFKITEIEENKVFVRCGEAEITLKLVQPVEMAE